MSTPTAICAKNAASFLTNLARFGKHSHVSYTTLAATSSLDFPTPERYPNG